MAHTRCNYCGQVVNFIDIRGNSTCPVCRQSSTSCCEGGSCSVTPVEQNIYEPKVETHQSQHATAEPNQNMALSNR